MLSALQPPSPQPLRPTRPSVPASPRRGGGIEHAPWPPAASQPVSGSRDAPPLEAGPAAPAGVAIEYVWSSPFGLNRIRVYEDDIWVNGERVEPYRPPSGLDRTDPPGRRG
jgi:hypothetical protein